MTTVTTPIYPGYMESSHPANTRVVSPSYTLVRLGLLDKHTLGLGQHGASEYQNKYGCFPPIPQRTRKRSPLHRPDGHNAKMDMQTSYGETFVQHPHQKRKDKKKEEFTPPDRIMDCKTIYRDDYSLKPIMRTTSFKPNRVFKEPEVRMGDESEYQVTYLTQSQEVADRCRSLPVKQKECLERVKDKFVAVSTVQNDYQKHENVERVRPIVQVDHEIGDKAPFHSLTTYNEYYTHKTLEPKPPGQSDFRPPVNPLRHPMYQPADTERFSSPFEGSTTQRTTYMSWPVERRRTPPWAKRNEYQRPRGGMLLCSTYDREYRDPGVVNRVEPTKNRNSGVIFSNGDVPIHKPDQATTYCANYRPWKHSKTAEVQKTYNLYVPPKEKLTTESIHRSHFTGQYAPPARPCHPKSENWHFQPGGQDPERVHFLTTYKETYTGDAQRVPKRKRMRKHLKDVQLNFEVEVVKANPEVEVVSDNSGDTTKDAGTVSDEKGEDSPAPEADAFVKPED